MQLPFSFQLPSVMNDSVIFAGCFTLTHCVAYVLNTWRTQVIRNGLPLPPRLQGLPSIGNLFNPTADKPRLSYEEWGRHYGDWP